MDHRTSPPRLSYAIMAVEQRLSHVEHMLSTLGHKAAVSVDVERRGPWPGWCAAWDLAGVSDPEATHRVVLQDDVLFGVDFPAAMSACVAARPDEVISAFLPRRSVEKAVDEGLSWVATRRFLWAQCVCIPVALGDAIISWVAEHEGEHPEWTYSDDVRLGAGFKALGRRVFVPVPNLVEHIGDALVGKSTLGHNGPPERRRARAWVGTEKPAAGLSWGDLRFVRD